MTGDCHAWICEDVRVRFPCVTRLDRMGKKFCIRPIVLKNSVSEINEKSLAHRPDKIFWIRGGIKIS